jgi:hypothetical protein
MSQMNPVHKLSSLLTFLLILILHSTYFFLWRCDPTRVMASSFLRFLDHTQRRTTVGRDLYLTTHNTHNRQTFMPPVGLEPTISAGEWPQTYALDRATTGTGFHLRIGFPNCLFVTHF